MNRRQEESNRACSDCRSAEEKNKRSAVKRDTFSVLFFIRKTRTGKNGEAPILIRITVNGVSQEAVIKRSVKPELWNQQAERASGKDRYAFEVNAYLDTVRSRIMQIHRQMESAR